MTKSIDMSVGITNVYGLYVRSSVPGKGKQFCICDVQNDADGQSTIMSWSQAPIWGPRTTFLLLLGSSGLVDVGPPL
jgi:hypothetical protein